MRLRQSRVDVGRGEVERECGLGIPWMSGEEKGMCSSIVRYVYIQVYNSYVGMLKL